MAERPSILPVPEPVDWPSCQSVPRGRVPQARHHGGVSIMSEPGT